MRNIVFLIMILTATQSYASEVSLNCPQSSSSAGMNWVLDLANLTATQTLLTGERAGRVNTYRITKTATAYLMGDSWSISRQTLKLSSTYSENVADCTKFAIETLI